MLSPTGVPDRTPHMYAIISNAPFSTGTIRNAVVDTVHADYPGAQATEHAASDLRYAAFSVQTRSLLTRRVMGDTMFMAANDPAPFTHVAAIGPPLPGYDYGAIYVKTDRDERRTGEASIRYFGERVAERLARGAYREDRNWRVALAPTTNDVCGEPVAVRHYGPPPPNC